MVIRKHSLDEVKPELQVEGRKGVSQTKESREDHFAKASAVGQLGFQSCCVCPERVRHEGGATEMGEIQKGLISHTRKFGFCPKGNQMRLKAFKVECGMIRFARFPWQLQEGGV